MALSAEALRTETLERSWHVVALGINSAGVGSTALIDIHTLYLRLARVAGWTGARVVAIVVGALRVRAAR